MTTAYWLGDDATEVEHLIAQAEVYAAEAGELLDRVGLAARASAIDVGCGVLGILPLLRERVGESGRVVGLDLEPPLLAAARERAHGLDAELVEADAAATGLSSAAFDLVHERTLLLNLTDPVPVVGEMVRLARPGGTVALQEPDATAWLCDPPHPAFDRLKEELLAVYLAWGATSTSGGEPAGSCGRPGCAMSRSARRRASPRRATTTTRSCSRCAACSAPAPRPTSERCTSTSRRPAR